MASPDRGYAQNFVGGGYSGPTFRDAVVNHGGHPSLHRGLVDGIAVSVGVNKAADALLDLQDLEYPDPSPVPGAAAPLAALRFVDRFAELEPQGAEPRIIGKVGEPEVAL